MAGASWGTGCSAWGGNCSSATHPDATTGLFWQMPAPPPAEPKARLKTADDAAVATSGVGARELWRSVVRKNGDEGYLQCGNSGIVTTNLGTVLAFLECPKTRCGDDDN